MDDDFSCNDEGTFKGTHGLLKKASRRTYCCVWQLILDFVTWHMVFAGILLGSFNLFLNVARDAK